MAARAGFIVYKLDRRRLSDYTALSAELLGLERQLEKLESDVYRIGGGFARVGRKSGNPSDFSGLLAKLADLKAHYERKWDGLIDLRREIEDEIDALPPVYRTIIRYKYIEGLTWEEIADLMKYSARQLIRLHNEVV